MALMSTGALLLVDRLDLAEVRISSELWPLFPIALGLVRLIDPGLRRDGTLCSRRSGLWMLLLGSWGLANEFHVYGLDYQNSWPLLIVLAGLNMVWRSVEAPPGPTRAERPTA
jgi:hypothetical protein